MYKMTWRKTNDENEIITKVYIVKYCLYDFTNVISCIKKE